MFDEEDYTNDNSGSQGGFDMGWIEIIMAGLDMGQENTIRSQQIEADRQNKLGMFLFRDRGGNNDIVVVGVLALVIGIALIVLLKK
jgi:hypothetical protein